MSSFICLHKGVAMLSNCEELKAFFLLCFFGFCKVILKMKAKGGKKGHQLGDYRTLGTLLFTAAG